MKKLKRRFSIREFRILNTNEEIKMKLNEFIRKLLFVLNTLRLLGFIFDWFERLMED